MNTKKDISILLFGLTYTIATVANTLGIPGENSVLRLILLISMPLFMLEILINKYDKTYIFLCGFMLIVSLLIYLKSTEISPLFTMVILIGLNKISFKDLMKYTLIIKVTVLILIFFSLLVGLRENDIMLFYRNGVEVKRYTFGYASPNSLMIQAGYITILLICLYWDRLKLRHMLILFLLNAVVYSFTRSRTTFFCVLFVMILTILKNIKFVKAAFLKIAPYIMILLLFVSILFMLYGANTPIGSYLDQALTGRVGYCYIMYHKFGITLFGADMTKTSIFYDNSYARLLTNLGLIYSIFILGNMFLITRQAARNKDMKLTLFLVYFQILALAESIYGYIFANISLILIAYKYRRFMDARTNSMIHDHTNKTENYCK